MSKRTFAMYSKVTGVNDVQSSLINTAFSDKETYTVVKAIANPIVDQLKTNAPTDEGNVRRSIQIFRSKKDPYRKVQIGPKYIKGGGPIAGNAAHFTEFGTVERTMKEGLRYGVVKGTLEKFAGPPQFTPYKGKKLGRVQSKEWVYKTYIQTEPQSFATADKMITELLEDKKRKNGLK